MVSPEGSKKIIKATKKFMNKTYINMNRIYIKDFYINICMIL